MQEEQEICGRGGDDIVGINEGLSLLGKTNVQAAKRMTGVTVQEKKQIDRPAGGNASELEVKNEGGKNSAKAVVQERLRRRRGEGRGVRKG